MRYTLLIIGCMAMVILLILMIVETTKSNKGRNRASTPGGSMRPLEATKYLIPPVCTSTEPSEEYRKQKEAYDLAVTALTEWDKWDHLEPVCANDGIFVYRLKERGDT